MRRAMTSPRPVPPPRVRPRVKGSNRPSISPAGTPGPRGLVVTVADARDELADDGVHLIDILGDALAQLRLRGPEHLQRQADARSVAVKQMMETNQVTDADARLGLRRLERIDYSQPVWAAALRLAAGGQPSGNGDCTRDTPKTNR